jgi:hypothetical protein
MYSTLEDALEAKSLGYKTSKANRRGQKSKSENSENITTL